MDRRFEGLRLGQPWVKVKKILNTLCSGHWAVGNGEICHSGEMTYDETPISRKQPENGKYKSALTQKFTSH